MHGAVGVVEVEHQISEVAGDLDRGTDMVAPEPPILPSRWRWLDCKSWSIDVDQALESELQHVVRFAHPPEASSLPSLQGWWVDRRLQPLTQGLAHSE